MITIVLVGAVTALAMFAILIKMCAGETKKAEKTEKGAIIKQLLALSELENPKAVVRTPAPPPAKAKPPQKTAQTPENASECVGL